MNGDSKELLQAIKDWGNERHKENLKFHKDIYNDIQEIRKTFNKLPCKGNGVWIKVLTISNGALWLVIGIIIGLRRIF